MSCADCGMPCQGPRCVHCTRQQRRQGPDGRAPGVDESAVWYRCGDCEARYRSPTAAERCCTDDAVGNQDDDGDAPAPLVADGGQPVDASMARIEMHNTPEPSFRVEPVGEPDPVTWHVDWEQMTEPSPTLFDDVSDVQVTLACIQTTYLGESEAVHDAYHQAMEAVNDLLRAMAEARVGDTPEAHDLYMGNLDVLPEVSTEWPPGQQTLDGGPEADDTEEDA